MKQRKIQRGGGGGQLAAGAGRSPIVRRRMLFDKSQQRSDSKTSKRIDCNANFSSNDDRSRSPEAQIPPKQAAYTCAACELQIRDKSLLHACNQYWHNNCLKCDRCHAKLGELGPTLFEKDKMKLCRQDYFEMFGQKAMCTICDKLIYASEMVMRAKQNVYHLECFACQLCGLRFCVGDRFHLFENKIVCQFDYDEHILPIQESMRLHHYQELSDNHHSNQPQAPHEIGVEMRQSLEQQLNGSETKLVSEGEIVELQAANCGELATLETRPTVAARDGVPLETV